MNTKIQKGVTEIFHIAKHIDSSNIDYCNAVNEMVKIEFLKFLFYLNSGNEFDEKQLTFIQDNLEIEITEQVKKKMACFELQIIESSIPNGLVCFINKYNSDYQKNPLCMNICNRYFIVYRDLGAVFAEYCENNTKATENADAYINMLNDYIAVNSLSSSTYTGDDIEEEFEIRGLQKESDFLKCPNCGTIIKKENRYCQKCLENFEDMVFTDENYIDTSLLPKYINISADNDKKYIRYLYTSQNAGIVIRIHYKTGEEYISDTFKVVGKNIVTNDATHGETYSMYKDYLYEPNTMYIGDIPESSYFEAYCSFNNIVKPIWFHADGTIQLYDSASQAGNVSNEGRYIREGDFIRADLTERGTGKKQTSVWLVIDGKLCRDAYVNDEGYSKLKELLAKPMPLASGTFSNCIITKEEFFNHYPCEYCNARQAWDSMDWKYMSYGSIAVSGKCRMCNNLFVECDEPKNIKKIAYKGSEPNPCYRVPAGATRYLDNPCPYCGAYQVRNTKWRDKQMSAAFWGFFSTKLHSNYKCEKCGKMWE